jgi:hypothetical protein
MGGCWRKLIAILYGYDQSHQNVLFCTSTPSYFDYVLWLSAVRAAPGRLKHAQHAEGGQKWERYFTFHSSEHHN